MQQDYLILVINRVGGEKMRIVSVIPARYNSSRFPGKPLADICGKPMIWWVYHQVKKTSRISDVIVATDDERIAETCSQYNMNYVMTSSNHETSTQRLFEVAQKVEADYYVCINGDEPLIEPTVIEAILPTEDELVHQDDYYVANLMTTMKNPVEVVDNTNIKVVVDKDNYALYMSRNAIPYPRSSLNFEYKKHLGVLIYNLNALKFFSETPKNTLEKIEDINELRFMENGIKLKMIEVNANTLSVDTPKDLEKVVSMLKTQREHSHE